MERREAEKEELEAKKADLIAQMGSGVKDVAVAAAEELRRHGWLYDGSLQGADLLGANLQGARFDYTTLPDGTKWIPDTDMTRFTDPDHPDFWRPEGPS